MQANPETSKKTSAMVLSRALEMRSGDLPPEGARFILGLGIRDEDQERMRELLTIQQRGGITPGERDELQSYIEADNVLSILRAQAVLALKKAGQRS
jgi:hypothetical protein